MTNYEAGLLECHTPHIFSTPPVLLLFFLRHVFLLKYRFSRLKQKCSRLIRPKLGVCFDFFSTKSNSLLTKSKINFTFDEIAKLFIYSSVHAHEKRGQFFGSEIGLLWLWEHEFSCTVPIVWKHFVTMFNPEFDFQANQLLVKMAFGFGPVEQRLETVYPN